MLSGIFSRFLKYLSASKYIEDIDSVNFLRANRVSYVLRDDKNPFAKQQFTVVTSIVGYSLLRYPVTGSTIVDTDI